MREASTLSQMQHFAEVKLRLISVPIFSFLGARILVAYVYQKIARKSTASFFTFDRRSTVVILPSN